MEIVKSTKNLEPLNQNVKDDFYKVPNLKFDVEKMRADLNTVLKKRTADKPLGKLIKPEDIASAVLFFCSPVSKMMTGQCLAVDEGSGEAISN